MSFLTNVLSQLTPPPIVNPVDYDGWEYKWKFLVFRPALLKNELFLLGGLIFYILFAFWGRSSNSKKVNKWLNAHLPLLEKQFSQPTLKGLTQDGYSDFFIFSTGRRNIASLHSVFALRPRHDFFQWAFQTLRTFVDLQYRPQDELLLDFKLLPGALPENFVWGVVAKDELLFVKNDRWDLTFTKTTENPLLPPSLSVMSEFADVTDTLFRTSTLATILKDPKALTYFRSLSVTDQPRERPKVPLLPNEREKHVLLSLRAPPASQAEDTLELVTALFAFVDSLNQIALRPETKTKLRKIREELDKAIKEDSEKEKKEELEQAKEDARAAKRKAEEERIAKLSASEQQKILEKEKKRSLRKQQGKQSVRK